MAFPTHSIGGLSVYALNANGMVHAGKVSQVSSVIQMRRPHVFVISETKTYDKVGKNLPTHEYNFFEETGIKMDNHHLYKWGVVVGVRKDIQVAQRVKIPSSLNGRVVAVDLVLGTNKGKGFLHRFIGTYAPWNPGADDGRVNFWTEVTKICNDSAFSWSLAGDLNATVSNTERMSGGLDARQQFLRFLHATNGHDLWSSKPERSRLHDWTCKSHNNQGSSGNIIDRVVVSRVGFIETDISVADKHYDFVQMTDHRAVIATLLPSSPNASHEEAVDIPIDLSETLHQPRVRYPPKKDKAKFEDYRKEVDKQVKELNLHEDTLTGEESFMRRYDALTRIIVGAAKQIFGVSRRPEAQTLKVTSPQIRRLETRLKLMGGALYFEARGEQASISATSLDTFWTLKSQYELSHNSTITLREFIKMSRKEVYKELYHARMNEIISRAQTRDRRKIGMALSGGSTKRLINTGEFIGLPTAVESPSQPGVIITNPSSVKEATCEYLTQLYRRSPPPNIPKPWMETPSVREVRERVGRNPFSWPQKADLSSFRAMLRKGNPKPAPGPDGWEKWCVKNLSDTTLQLVLDLHNYEVMNSVFPGNVKDMTCTMFHKQNL